jgi:hypothetical protein
MSGIAILRQDNRAGDSECQGGKERRGAWQPGDERGTGTLTRRCVYGIF